MKVGIFCYDLHSTAPSIRARILIEEIERQGVHLKVFTSQKDRDVKASEVIEVRLGNMLRIAKELRELDLVHVPVNFFQAILVKLFHKGRITLDVGIQQTKFFRLLTKVLIKPSIVIKPIKVSANDWLEDGVNSTVLYAPRDWSNYKKYPKDKIRELRNEMGFTESDKVILYVGKLNYFKGVHILQGVAKRLPQYNFIAIGDGVKPEEDNIIHLGHIKNIELPKYYNIADATLVPNLIGNNGGLVAMESVACGTPVINTMNNRELNKEIERCYIWCERDVYEVTDTLTKLLKNPKHLKKTHKQSNIVKNVYPTPESFAAKYIEIFKKHGDVDDW